MPKIEQYEASKSLPQAPGVQVPQTTDAGALLKASGEELTNATNKGLQLYVYQQRELERQQRQEDQIEALKAVTKFRNELAVEDEAAKLEFGESAAGYATSRNKAFETRLSEVRSALPTSQAQNLFEVMARQYHTTFFNQASNYEVLQGYANRISVLSNIADQSSVALFHNPSSYDSIVRSYLTVLDSQNIPPDVKEKQRQKSLELFSETLVRSVANRNPTEALRMLDAGEFDKRPGFNLTGLQLNTLRAHIKSLEGQNRSEAKSELGILLDNQLANYSLGRTNVTIPAGMTLSQIEETLGPANFANYKNRVQVASQMRQFTQDLQSQPIQNVYSKLNVDKKVAERLAPFDAEFVSAGNAYSVSPAILYNMAAIESGGVTTAVSEAGAKGLMQFIPSTAAAYGVNADNPISSIRGAARYMQDLLKTYGGDYEKALTAYHSGEGNVNEAIAKYGDDWLKGLGPKGRVYAKSVLGYTPGGVAGEVLLENQIAAINAEAKLREKDPAAVAERNALLLDGETYSALSLPQKIARRLAIQENDLGIAPHKRAFLTGNEQETFIKQIEGSSPDQAQQTIAQLKNELSENTVPGVVDPFNSVFSELVGKGLDSGYLFSEFMRERTFGNVFLEAMRTKDAEAKAGFTEENKTAVTQELTNNTDLSDFLRIMTSAGGAAGGRYAGRFYELLERTTFMAARDNNIDVSVMAKKIVEDAISSQMTMKGTYYVPNRDPVTNTPLDPEHVDDVLYTAGLSFVTLDGKFEPVVESGVPFLSPAYSREQLNNASNLAWIPNHNGTGVVRAIKIPGIGLFSRLVDKDGRLFEIKFSDIDALGHKLGLSQIKEPNIEGTFVGP